MLVAQRLPTSSHTTPFTTAELTLMRGWADAEDLRMDVHRDPGTGNEDAVAFAEGNRPWRNWNIWRDAGTVFMEAAEGLGGSFASVAQALETFSPRRPPELTNITLARWPTSGDHG